MTITELSIKRPTLVIVVFTVLGVLGVFSYTQLKYELLPKITPPYVTIVTIYPGASPAEVETSVTKIVEDAVSGIGGLISSLMLTLVLVPAVYSKVDEWRTALLSWWSMRAEPTAAAKAIRSNLLNQAGKSGQSESHNKPELHGETV